MIEANHGPFVIDNNIVLSPKAIENPSQGGAYAHNLIAGGRKLARLSPGGKRKKQQT